MPRRRLGVALLLPPVVAAEVDGIRRALGDPSLGRIPPHITLVPPVNVRADDLEAAVEVLRRAASRAKPFELTLGPPRSFLPDNPVVYLSVWGFLDRLQALRDAVFTAPLERDLTWPFVPHVTLADNIEPARAKAAVDTLTDYERDVVISAVHLLQERVHERGERRWHVIADVPFALPGVVGRGGIELELTVTDTVDASSRDWLDDQWPAPRRPLTVTARRDDNAVVGIATGWTDHALANLSDLFVAPHGRGQGAGGHLVARFVATAIERGATRCRLRTDAGSLAEQFFRNRGWAEEARYAGAVTGSEIVQLLRML
jgi:2'-5' RNA ligase